tara:strand:- start:61 stop:642 length:582 start_codon:yes stop_codon:yes gene_type:complete
MHKYLSFKEYTVLFYIAFFVLLSSCATNGVRIEEGHYEVGQQRIFAAFNPEFIYLNKVSKEEIMEDLEVEFRKYKYFNSDGSSISSKYVFNEQFSMSNTRNRYSEKLKMLYLFSCIVYCETAYDTVWIKLSITKGEKIVYEIEKEDTITYRQSIFLLPGVLLLPFENYPKKVILNLHKRVLEQSLLDQVKWLE